MAKVWKKLQRADGDFTGNVTGTFGSKALSVFYRTDNKPSKSDVGLGSVENKSAATIMGGTFTGNIGGTSASDIKTKAEKGDAAKSAVDGTTAITMVGGSLSIGTPASGVYPFSVDTSGNLKIKNDEFQALADGTVNCKGNFTINQDSNGDSKIVLAGDSTGTAEVEVNGANPTFDLGGASPLGTATLFLKRKLTSNQSRIQFRTGSSGSEFTIGNSNNSGLQTQYAIHHGPLWSSGTADERALSFDADGKIGMYANSKTVNGFTFGSDGTNKHVYIKDGGLGIGTTNTDDGTLKVAGAGAGSAPIIATNGSYGNLQLAYGSPPNYGSGKQGIHSSYALAIGTSQSEVDIGTSSGTAIEITGRNTELKGNLDVDGPINGNGIFSKVGSNNHLQIDSGGQNYIVGNLNPGDSAEDLGISIYPWANMWLHNKLTFTKQHGTHVSSSNVFVYQDGSNDNNLVIDADKLTVGGKLIFDPPNSSFSSTATTLYLSANSGNSALKLGHSSSTPTLEANSGGKIGILSNLGIGTASPSETLEVSDAYPRMKLISEGHNSATGSSAHHTFFGYDSSGARPFIISNQSNTPIVFKQNGGTEVMKIDVGGDVGISNNLVLSGSTKGIDFKGSGKHILSGSGSGSYIELNNVGQITPNSNNGFSLGTSSSRWSNVYTQLLNVAGESTLAGNLTVQKSFPDIALRANNEQRLNFMDNGGSIQSGIKNNAGTMKFYGSSSSSSIRAELNNSGLTVAGDLDASAGQSLTGWHTKDLIWVMPSDFIANDDTSFYNMALVDSGGKSKPMTNSLEAYCNIPIPSGYEVTKFRLNGTSGVGIAAYSSDCTTGNTTSVQPPTNIYTNTEYSPYPNAIEANDSTGKYFILKFNCTSTAHEIYGGYLKIAKI